MNWSYLKVTFWCVFPSPAVTDTLCWPGLVLLSPCCPEYFWSCANVKRCYLLTWSMTLMYLLTHYAFWYCMLWHPFPECGCKGVGLTLTCVSHYISLCHSLLGWARWMFCFDACRLICHRFVPFDIKYMKFISKNSDLLPASYLFVFESLPYRFSSTCWRSCRDDWTVNLQHFGHFGCHLGQVVTAKSQWVLQK